MKIKIIKESMQEGAEEIGASIGRGIDQMVSQIQNLPQEAKNKVIKALGGYTQEEYRQAVKRGVDRLIDAGIIQTVPGDDGIIRSRPREDDPDFGAA